MSSAHGKHGILYENSCVTGKFLNLIATNSVTAELEIQHINQSVVFLKSERFL